MYAVDIGYSHTQRGFVSLILFGCGILEFAVSFLCPAPHNYFVLGTSPLFFFGGLCFHYLKVQDRGDRLSVSFGPIPLFWRTARYADILGAEVDRTTILDGWGIHASYRGGWVWNIWGRDCVLVKFKHGVLRIGTDDAENLSAFLNGKAQPG